MKLVWLYKKVDPRKFKLRKEFDKKSNGRPAWVKINGLPKGINFIRFHFGKRGKEGLRIQYYKTYLSPGYFLPIDYTKQEMSKFYDKWSEDYDRDLMTRAKGQNVRAAEFLIKKIKKYVKKGDVLDLGAGTGLITEVFVKKGFGPITLVDYSEGMLKKAKKKKSLKDCTFVKKDVLKLNLGKKFDVVLSSFSFGARSYFDPEERKKIFRIVNKHLKKNGIFAVVGHFGEGLFDKDFKKLDGGPYALNKKDYTDYFIGRKK